MKVACYIRALYNQVLLYGAINLTTLSQDPRLISEKLMYILTHAANMDLTNYESNSGQTFLCTLQRFADDNRLLLKTRQSDGWYLYRAV